jgi:hypothetical protein
VAGELQRQRSDAPGGFTSEGSASSSGSRSSGKLGASITAQEQTDVTGDRARDHLTRAPHAIKTR